MAIYHMSAQVIGRSSGRSSVAAAAYRSGERITDERTGLDHDYTKRRGGIEAETLAPEGAPAWATERAQLWNQVEATERRRDAQLCREVNVALPRELSAEQQRELVRGYVQEQFVSRGMVADVAIHRHDANNPHAHVMLTMREIGPEGFGKKVREWNQTDLLEQWREQWATHANRALERAGELARIDHRSHVERGITELQPTVHEGPHVRAMERQGIETDRGATNRVVQEYNANVIDLAQARQEREALHRSRDRWRSGHWDREGVEAVEAVERRIGRQIKPDELEQTKRQGLDQARELRAELARIDQEADRISRAGEAVDRYEQAARELRAQRYNPLKWGQRLFSPSARNAYRDAELKEAEARKAMEACGVKDGADLAQQRGQFEPLRQQKAELTSKLDRLQVRIGQIDQAIQGFTRAAFREREQERTQERQQRRREMDRGR